MINNSSLRIVVVNENMNGAIYPDGICAITNSGKLLLKCEDGSWRETPLEEGIDFRIKEIIKVQV